MSAFAWKFMFNQRFGLINASLESMGLDPVEWFNHRWTALFAASSPTSGWACRS